MRVLLLIKRFDFGGAENHVCDLANELSLQGTDVFVMSPSGRQKKRLIKDVKHISLKLRSILAPIQALYVAFVIKRKKIDVIHAHQNRAIFTASIASWLTSVPLVATIHGRTRYDMRTRLARTKPVKIIFVSKRVRDASPMSEKINGRSELIPNGIKIHSNNGSPIRYSMCYVSRIDRKHGQFLEMIITKVLPLIFPSHPSFSFLIVGEGKKLEHLKTLADQLHKNTGKEICYFAGYQDDLNYSVAESSLVIGAGRVAIAGLISGHAVLSANINRLGGMINTENYDQLSENNFLDIRSSSPTPEALTDIITGFLEKQDYWKNQAEILQKRAVNEFDISVISSRISRVYEDALKPV